MDDAKYIAEMTERYIYEVTKRLSASQKADIEKELRGLIEDMLFARTDSPSREDIDSVLTGLGRPSELANKYRDTKKHLIGPYYFDTYMLVLKIVLAATAFGMTVAIMVGYFVQPPASVLEALGGYAGAVISALFQAFGCLTIAFALAERYGKNTVTASKEQWSPKDLPPVPGPTAVIKKWEPIVGMVFAILAIILFNFAPQLIGVHIPGQAPAVIPIFNMETYWGVLPLINFSLGIGLLKEIARLAAGRYTLKLAVATLVFNVVSMILVLFIFTDQNLWNQGFAESVKAIEGLRIPVDFDLAYYLGISAKVILGLFVFGTIVDTVSAFYKGLKHDDAGTVNRIIKKTKAHMN